MIRSDVKELHYITAIDNVPSILEYGILCHRAAEKVKHASVAMAEIQGRRSKKIVPGGKPLHDYANLYFTARNPMLYLRRNLHMNLCVLQVNSQILDLPNVIIADGNGASGYTAFFPSPSGLSRVDSDLVYAESWTDSDQITEWQKKRVKCAEVLVPERVAPRFIVGAYVSCAEAERALKTVAPKLASSIDTNLFFL